MENLPIQNDNNRANILKQFYKPEFSGLFNIIKTMNAPIKNDILIALLDGQWHSETELVRIAKKQQYIGPVTLGTIIGSLNRNLTNDYLQKRFISGEMYYKISDNYIGLTRAAYSKYRFKLD